MTHLSVSMVELSETLDEHSLIDPKIQEKELLSDLHFQQFLAKAKQITSTLNERALLKIFIVSQMHAGKAMEALTETIKWRENNVPVFNEMNSHPNYIPEEFVDMQGILRFSGHDLKGYPVLYCQLQSMTTTLSQTYLQSDKKIYLSESLKKEQGERDRFLKFLIFQLERALYLGIVKDKLTIVLDRGVLNEPSVALAKTIVPIFLQHYPERLYQAIVFPTQGASSWLLWKSLKPILGTTTASKILLKNSPVDLLDYIDQEQASLIYSEELLNKKRSKPPIKKKNSDIPEMSLVPEPNVPKGKLLGLTGKETTIEIWAAPDDL